ncbi:MAG: peptidylprolyl isomerase [Gemmatales bacterium]
MGLGFFSRRTPSSTPRPAARRTLAIESLEDRLVLTVSLGTITAVPVLATKHTYIPVSATDTNGLPLTYSVTSANSNIVASIYTGGRTLVLNVSGKDSSGVDFNGNLVLKLFEDKMPKTTARIVELVNSGFYNGLIFHRVIKGFVAQGGDPAGNGTGGSGTNFDDEFKPSLTFNSFGLLAMANAGDDDNDSQFFITDTASSATFPQHLNFNHNIFGQIVDGLDIFQKIMNTPVTSDKPNTDVKINQAYLVNTNKYAILDLSSVNSFTGSGNVTITAKNSRNETASTTVSITAQADAVNGTPTNDRPFLNDIRDTQITKNTVLTFDVTATDLENDALTFVVRKADFSELTAADHVTVSITQLNNVSARITLTPDADFTGLLNLKIGVTSVVSNPQTSDYDTQAFNVLVTDNPLTPTDLALVSGTGVNPGNTVTTDTPTIELKAPAGKTVKILLGGTEIGTATETSTAGTYRFTIPGNKLLLGANSITAITTENDIDSLPSAVLTVTFAPLMQQVYVVPGAAGEQVTLTFDFLVATAGFKNELGLFVVDDLSGTVNGVAPSASNYWSTVAADNSRQVIFSFQPGGSRATKTFTFEAGTKLGFYLSANSTFNVNKAKSIYSSIKAANQDGIFHAEHYTERTGSRAVYGFEDSWKGGDRDFNDMVFSIRKTTTVPAVGALQVDLASPSNQVKGNFAMLPTLNSRYRPMGGEIGIFQVLNAQGTIAAPTTADPNRTLNPGDAGYAQAALSQVGKQVLFTKGDVPAETTRSINMAGGSYFGVYYINKGTAANFLSVNPANAITSGQPNAFFSFAGANPDGGKVHMRTYGKNGVSRTQTGLLPSANDAQRIHIMGVANGGDSNFSDFILTYNQSL